MIREKQIKTMMRYRFILTRIAIIKKKDSKCWWRCGEIGMLMHCYWECKMVEPLWKVVLQFLKILKLPYDLVIQLQERGKHAHTKFCTLMFIAALLIVAKCRNNPNICQLIEWINKMWYINKILFGNKNEWLIYTTTWMNPKNIKWKASRSKWPNNILFHL